MPEEITLQGDSAERKFRDWFDKHEELFLSNPELFQVRLWAEFGVKVSLHAITRKNSGAVLPSGEVFEGIYQRIADLLQHAEIVRSASPTIARHGDWAHTPLHGLDAEARAEIEEWKREKGEIKNEFVRYFQVRFNPDLRFDGRLLERIGFVPCSECAPHLRGRVTAAVERHP